MNFPKISHHGAVTGVTGSCHELHWDDNNSILVDCGIFQGSDSSPYNKANADDLEIDFSIQSVKALVLTHCHIDHAGRIPWLMAAGFDKPIYCSKPTTKLLPVMLEDAAKIGITRDKRLVKMLVKKIESLVQPIDYATWLNVSDGLKIRLQRAGHILGSAYVECELENDEERRIVFSGDLGAPNAPLLPPPSSPKKCHTLVIESTYGDKNHPDRANRKERLKTVIEHCFKNRGAILIPAFSLGRTQELMYEFEQIIHAHHQEWGEMEIIIDSPLASRITQVYRELKPYWDDEAQHVIEEGRYPLTFKQLHCVDSYEEHEKIIELLQKTGRPTIIIGASGMCNGGRIADYLKALLGDKRTDIIFTGYQAKGSVGRNILKHGPDNGWVKIDGERYTIQAKIHRIDGYSAHADQQTLLGFASQIEEGPKEIRVIHGDDKAKRALRNKLEASIPAATVFIPKN